jgi:hypothetical protein
MGSEGSGKIISTLLQRREIEEQIRRLVDLKDDAEIEACLAQILAHGESVTTTLLANLDTSSPLYRGALGLVASRLPREHIVPALRVATLDQTLSDQARLSAMTILERYLDEEIDAGQLAGLSDPRAVARQSVSEVIAEARRDRNILIEYMRSFREQPIEIANLVLEAIEEMEPAEQPDLLRMLAQDERETIRDAALAILGRNRTPAAGRALQMLLPTLPAEAAPTIRRALRKRALAGIPAEPLPPPDPTWRALVSPVDGQGHRSIWFIYEPCDADDCRFLSVLLDDAGGLRDAFGGDNVRGQHFPAPAALGTLHPVTLQARALRLNLLEAEFDYGRRLVYEALRLNFERRNPTPYEYRLLNDFLWGYTLEETRLTPALPEVSQSYVDISLPLTDRLLDLPDFATWFALSPAIYEYANRLRGIASFSASLPVPRQGLAELANVHFADGAARAVIASRLRAMSEWLLHARQQEQARLALAAAQAIDQVPPAQHPFLMRLVQIGLSAAISALSQGLSLRVSGRGDA